MSLINLGYYDGSKYFSWLCTQTGLTLDLVNYGISQVTGIILAICFRKYFHPHNASPSTRHLFSAISGLLMSYFCFGRQMIHIILLPLICYIVMLVFSPKISQRIVLIIAVGYQSYVHLMRQIYSYGSYVLDVTGPLMVITQKVTSLAFSLHDGLGREDSSLTEDQRKYSIKKRPSILEFTSYMYHYQTVMLGPLVFYKDYINFIDGSNIKNYSKVEKAHKNGINGSIANGSNSHEPSPLKPVLTKIGIAFVYLFLLFKVAPKFPPEILRDSDFLRNTPFPVQVLKIFLIALVAKFKYYYAWLLADAIANASGLGFDGYDQNGKAKWNLISNVDILNIELGTNLYTVGRYWNIGTSLWLQRVAHDRSPAFMKTWAAIGLSTVWHGFYPGYFFACTSGFILILAARKVRRCIRPFFQVSSAWARFYDVVTTVVTQIGISYIMFPFVLLELEPSLNVFKSIGFYFHILGLLTIFILPRILPPKQKPKGKES